MAQFGTNFNPSAVMMGRGSGSSPYLWTGAGSAPPKPQPISAGTFSSSGPAAPSAPVSPAPPPAPPGNVLGAESIRATGTGPFDAQYRQNLATYAGGQFSRPGGSMSFNPTDPSTFPGQPTGAGTAPVIGMPQSLLDVALGGQGFSWTPPPPANTSVTPGDFSSLQDWMNEFLKNGRSGRMGSIV